MVAVLAEHRGIPFGVPWRDERDARHALSCLASTASGRAAPDDGSDLASAVDRRQLAAWLEGHDLGALGFAQALGDDSELAPLLRAKALGAAAGNLAHFETLERIERRFASESIPMVLLKGAAVAFSAYRDSSFRPMTDLDI